MTDASDDTQEASPMEAVHENRTSPAGPIGAGLGLVAAVAAGFFLSEPVGEPNGAPEPDARPSGLAQPEGFGGVEPPSRPPIAPEIVVKFKGELGAACKAIADQFWADKDGARLRFSDLVGDHPELEGLQLKRATYSGELVLELSDPAPGMTLREVKAAYSAATKRLRASPDVSYAEPNSTAQPGKDD